jgi:hypothetical protein
MSDILTTHNFHADTTTFWIAHGDGTLYFGTLDPNENISTGLEFLETFTKRRPWMARVIELGGSFE